jgi:hypothetical protein
VDPDPKIHTHLLLMDPDPNQIRNKAVSSVADPDPGSGIGAFLTPGSQTHMYESLVTTFWVKSSIIL